MATMKEIRIRFSENELILYEYISSKRSASGFLKDLATLEMKRENKLINGAETDINAITLNVVKALNEMGILNSLSVNYMPKENTEPLSDNIEVDKDNDFIDDFDDDFDD